MFLMPIMFKKVSHKTLDTSTLFISLTLKLVLMNSILHGEIMADMSYSMVSWFVARMELIALVT